MDLKAMSKEEIQEIPMVEIAFEVMKQEGKPFNYYDLFESIVALKNIKKEEAQIRIAKLYTDINIDGRFHSLGDNQWGLKTWYPLEQTDEEITTPVKLKKKAKTEENEEIDFDDYEDEYEDLEDELDEVLDKDDEEEETDFDEKEDLEDLDDEEIEEEDFEDEDDLE